MHYILGDKNNYWEHCHDFQEGTKVNEAMAVLSWPSPQIANQQYCKFLSPFQYRQHRISCKNINKQKVFFPNESSTDMGTMYIFFYSQTLQYELTVSTHLNPSSVLHMVIYDA